MIDTISSIHPDAFIILKLIIIIAVSIATLFFVLLSFVTIKKTDLLNRTLKTDFAKLLKGVAVLFFVFSVGTLLLSISIWIKVFESFKLN